MDTNIKLGFLLYRNKGFVEHVGVYLGQNQVLHNSPSGNIEIINLETYADGKAVKVIETGEHDHTILQQRLTQILTQGGPYHVIANNCEHIAHFLIFGRKSSPQIQAALVGAVIVGLISWKTQRGNPLFLAVIGALLVCVFNNQTKQYDAVLAGSPCV